MNKKQGDFEENLRDDFDDVLEEAKKLGSQGNSRTFFLK